MSKENFHFDDQNKQYHNYCASDINNSLQFRAKTFVRGHYLFREANSFPRKGQISEDIFTPNGGYSVNYNSNVFRNTRGLENRGMSLAYSPVLVGEYSLAFTNCGRAKIFDGL